MTAHRGVRVWNDVAIGHLLDSTSCPVCQTDALVDRRCGNCGVHVPDELVTELWAASKAAAVALREREEIVRRLPRPVSTTATVGAMPPPPKPQRVSGESSVDAGSRLPVAPRSSATVQSVLAVAGAGLFAVSAIVFTFFNPDLSDRALRSVIVGFITILFLCGAWLLARRKLRFSAEAVGALGMVFLALDVYAFSESAPSGVSPWILAAIGTLVSGLVMVFVATRAGIRSWLWISLAALTIVPAMLGYAGGSILSANLGHLGVAFAALAVRGAIPGLAERFDGKLQPELMTISTLQIVATVSVLTQIWSIGSDGTTEYSTTGYWLTITAVLAAVAMLAVFATRQGAGTFWSAVAGAAGMAAAVCLPFAFDLWDRGAGVWYLTVMPATGAAALLTLTALAPRARELRRRPFLAGAFAVAGASVLPSVLLAVQIGTVTVLGSLGGRDPGSSGLTPPDSVIAVVFGLAAMSLGLGAFSRIAGRLGAARTEAIQPGPASLTLAETTGSIALWLAALAGLTFACLSTFPLEARIAIALGLAVALSMTTVAVPRLRNASLKMRLPLLTGSHFAVLLAAIYSSADARVTVWAGIGIVAAIAIISRAVPNRIRFLHVGAGYAYALFVFATALDQLGVPTIALLCLTTSLASLGAIAATFLRWVTPRGWYAILVVTSVPFLVGVVQVVFERSGWTALSTALIFLLALALLITRRAGLGRVLRSIAAGLLVPSLAVVVVCLGAQVLLGSASPVTLPVIAAIVAVVLPCTGLIGSMVRHRGIPAQDASAARIAIEGSTLLTGVIAVVLALVRVAAGLPTTFLVLVILGLGAAATSLWAKRRYGWWLAAASFTGALWCLWALAGVDTLEPYLLPPSLAAAIVGMILTARGVRAVALYTTGLVAAVAPILALLAVAGSVPFASAPWRGYGLVAAAWLLLALGALLGRSPDPGSRNARVLAVPTLCVAITAGAAGAIQGVRFGVGADTIMTGGVPLVLLCFAIGVAGALPAALSARGIRWIAPDSSRLVRTRWLHAPAALYVAVATWTAIERDWFTIWAMWSLMLAYLVVVVVLARRLRSHPTGMPPVWFIFAIAFVTSVVAWSPRDLRVEWFSLPLGIFLLAAGAVALRDAHLHPDARRGRERTVDSWPSGWNGSWSLLAPGLVTMLSASVVATFTDPLTWRAILVIVIALIAILLGSSLKLAAPFLIGIVVLPIENVLVFVVQIGRGIESMPWWITLAVVGAVLLIIAVTYERRAGEENSIADRLRDLR